MPHPPDENLATTDPPTLLAIMIAARRSGDAQLERIARRELEARHAIRVSFAARPREVADAR